MRNNPVLDKNLACIARYNPNLKYRILQIQYLKNDISFVQTVLHEPNLVYNGTHLHNNYGAQAEAKEIFERTENTEFSMHVVFGFGLGYLVQEFALKSKGVVFVYEPDIEILATTLEVADLSQELSNKNVFIFNDFDELKRCYLKNYIYNSTTTITYLPAYKQIFGKELNDFATQLNFVMGSVIIDINYTKSKLIPAVKSVCNNMDLLLKEPPLKTLENIYEGKTALIVGAGPSLDKNIEIIKKYRKKAIIFAVGQSAKTLMGNGIVPDFMGLVETGSQMSQIENLDTSDVDLILEPSTYNGLHMAKFKNKFSYPSKNSSPNLIWTSFVNEDPSKYVTSGTVSFMMMYSAMILGFKDLILVGQDLAFLDGRCYSKVSQHTGLVCEIDEKTGRAVVKIEDLQKLVDSLFSKDSFLSDESKIMAAKKRAESMNKNMCSVLGIKGNTLVSTLDYASFIHQFSAFAKDFKDKLNLYNTSLEGAKINGFEDIPLEEILKDKLDVERIDLKPECSYDVVTLLTNINSELVYLEQISSMLNSANTLIFNFDKEFNNRKNITDICMKYFKQLMLLYIDLTDTFISKSRIFAMLQKSNQLDLNYTMKVNKNNSTESINKVYSKLKNYMNSLQTNISEVKNILQKKVKTINEMLDTKS